MSSTIFRRTRSRRLADMLETLNKLKKKENPVEDLSGDSKRPETEQTGVFGSNAASLTPEKRRRIQTDKDDEDIIFVGTSNIRDSEEPERVGQNIAGSDSVSSLSSGNVINIDSDEGIGSVESDSEDEGYSSDSSYEESSESDSMDYSDSSYEESTEVSEHDSYEENRVQVDKGNTATSKKRSIEKKYSREKKPYVYRRNSLNEFHRLASSIWDKDAELEEDESLSEEQEAHHCKEVPTPCNTEFVCKNRKRINMSERNPVISNCNSEDESFCYEKVEQPAPLNPKFGCEDSIPIEKTEEEKELNLLWEEMAFAQISDEIHSSNDAKGEEVLKSQDLCNGKHEFIIDEEIGLKCYYCSYVSVEIRDISPTMEKCCNDYVSDKKIYKNKKDGPLLKRFEFGVSDGSNSEERLNNKTRGTVWECIPGIKDSLYPHQQEGFEFIWRNLTGTIDLEELKCKGRREEDEDCGGCIISHSPGTGKTRLAIVFLQAYLELFPSSCPVIIAPASMLLTWEEEFKKWNMDVPFYNMNCLEFSGKESSSARSILRENSCHSQDKNFIRMVKLFSWCKKKSVLGVSYSLFMKLAGEKSDIEKGRKKESGQAIDQARKEISKILLRKPGLVILDEGHTPRNQNSCIFKVLSHLETRNRVILSGTPFQNNFSELSNVLCLTRPACANMISERLKILSKMSSKGKADEEAGIMELKALISPFVHVHKASVLMESLPGLRDCIVVLTPQFLQKRILDRIDRSQNTFKLEHKLAAVSVHPSLFLGCPETRKEELLIGKSWKEKLDNSRLDPKEGVKARFVTEFIRFSQSLNEKVLVFSQYIDILKLIQQQLISLFDWTEGKQVYYIDGKLEQNERQNLINRFNGGDCEAKVLLASTRACSEGINLVGASRVLLLDVVWNPSVERQAISRAYRLGQKRKVYIYHLVIKDMPECNKYCKQAEKHRISELVFSNNNSDDGNKKKDDRVVSEDKILDEMIRHEKLEDMFDKIIYQHEDNSHLLDNFPSAAF